MNNTERFILNTLKQSGKWVSAARLCEICGMADRNLRRHVKALIEVHREPIISGDDGFKFCTDPEEKSRFARRLAAHALSELKRARALGLIVVGEKTIRQMELQLGRNE